MQSYKREGKSKGRDEIAWSPKTNNNKNIFFLLMRDNPKRDCKTVHNLGLKKYAKRTQMDAPRQHMGTLVVPRKQQPLPSFLLSLTNSQHSLSLSSTIDSLFPPLFDKQEKKRTLSFGQLKTNQIKKKNSSPLDQTVANLSLFSFPCSSDNPWPAFTLSFTHNCPFLPKA